MYLSRTWNIGYLASPKSGSSSTAKMFTEQLGAVQIAGHHESTELALRERYHMVTTIRDHLDTMASWWAGDGCRGNVLMVPWLEHFIGRCPWIRDHKLWWMHAQMANEIVRFESMESDWRRIFRERGIPEDKMVLEHTNPSPMRRGRDWREVVTPEAEVWIRTYFREERLQYSYESILSAG